MANPATSLPLTRDSVVAAHKLIKPLVHRTPVLTCKTLDKLSSTPRTAAELQGTAWAGSNHVPARPVLRLWFKCENLQRIGAFKVRGAFHAVERLKKEPGWVENGGMQKGVATHSSGNHAQALALAARESGIPAHIVMPTISAPAKIAATRGYGATIIFSGSTSVEREAVAAKVIADTGARLVPPYDHPDILLGQGTMGLELQEQVEQLQQERQRQGTGTSPSTSTEKGGELPAPGAAHPRASPRRGLDAIITPCGGGGMLSGVALSAEGTGIRVFGAEPAFEGADDLCRGLAAGTRVEAVDTHTVADGLRTPVGVLPWSIIHGRRLVAGAYAVSEVQILAAMRLVLERMKLVVEPSAAVPLAVVLYNEDFRAMVEREAGAEGWDLGVVFSGGNVGLEALGTLFAAAK